MWGLGLARFTDASPKQKGTYCKGMLPATKMRSQMGTALYGILRQVHEAYTEIHARLKELKDKKVGFLMIHDEPSYEDEKI